MEYGLQSSILINRSLVILHLRLYSGVSSKKVKRKAKEVDEWGWATRFHEPSSNSVKPTALLKYG